MNNIEPIPHPRSADLLTIGAISVISYIIANVVHEGIGHGGACLLVGGIPQELTTAYFEWDSGAVSDTARRFVAAGGTLANLLASLLFWLAFRTSVSFSPYIRSFLWLSMSVNYFVAAGYPLFSGVGGIGDWVVVVDGWEPRIAWRIGLAVIGGATYFWGVLASLRLLSPLIGSRASGRQPRAVRFTVASYLVGCVTSTLGSLLNPLGIGLVFTSAAAHFGGTSALAWMAQMLRGPRAPEHDLEPLLVDRNYRWIATAGVLLAIHIVVLGPGIRW